MESEALTALLNSYLDEMSSIALEHGGTIDKFIGDAIMVPGIRSRWARRKMRWRV